MTKPSSAKQTGTTIGFLQMKQRLYSSLRWVFAKAGLAAEAFSRWAWTRKWSVLACILSLVLGFVSLGLLGLFLYYPVAPVLLLRFPPPDAWTGDWVWPAMLEVSFLWPLGFLIAGELDERLARRQTPVLRRRIAYGGTLWLWLLAVWFFTLSLPPN